MGVAAALVIESDRISSLASPSEIDNPHLRQVAFKTGGKGSTKLPPNLFYEVGPVLAGLGVPVIERRYTFLERVMNLVRPGRTADIDRTIILAGI